MTEISVEVEHVTVNHEITTQSTEQVEVGEGIPAQIVISETGSVGPRGLTGPTGPAGPKGDPGGQGIATPYSGDLNNLTTPGVYEVYSGTNLPVGGFIGIVVVNTSPIGVINQTAMVARRSFVRVGLGEVSGAWSEYGVIGQPNGAPLKGTGFPEGVVTAPVGVRYIDTAATNGAIEWIKASGTGNTGWKVAYGDTGWRSLDSIIDQTKFTIYNNPGFKIRRVNNEVYISVVDLTTTPNLPANTPFFTMPDGFRHTGSNYLPLLGMNINTYAMAPLRLTASYATQPFAVSNAGTFNSVRFALETQYSCIQSWPTTLPGTAA